MHPLDDERIDRELLRCFRFDEPRFRLTVDQIASGTLTEASSTIAAERISPARPGDTTDLTGAADSDNGARIRAGQDALARGKVAVMVVNGGMATRFGGVVKGVVDVFSGETFISLKAADVRRAWKAFGGRIPFLLMNSFATGEATRGHIESRRHFGLPVDDVLTFDQSISLRLNPDASLFIGDDGRPSYYAPGHGDFFDSIRASGVLHKLRTRGVETLWFSNVDNLGATIDPSLLGAHVLSGADMSAEITEKRRTASGAWDKGGAPVYVDGRLRILEGFRFPPSFQQDRLPDFSTNNFLFQTAALDRDVPLDHHLVSKKVGGRTALQVESITCEASGTCDAAGTPLFKLGLMRVPRDGARGRFFPVKEPEDLETLRDPLRERLTDVLAARGHTS